MGQQDIQSKHKNEVDLLEILFIVYRKIILLLRYFFASIGVVIIYLLRKSLWLALFVAVGIVAGVVLDRRIPKVYRSEAIVRSNNLAITIVVDNIKKLNNLCNLKNYQELSQQLDISEADAGKISGISAEYGLFTYKDYLRNVEQPLYYARKYAWDDTTMIVSKFVKITVKVFDESVYATLMQGLNSFIGNNVFGYKVNELRVEQLESQIAYAEHEIAMLQQIQATYTSRNSNASVQLELNGALQKSEQVQLHETINRLYQQKISLEREYTLFTQPTTVVSDFSKTYQPTVGLFQRIVRATLVSALLGFAVLLLWETRKKSAIAGQKK